MTIESLKLDFCSPTDAEKCYFDPVTMKEETQETEYPNVVYVLVPKEDDEQTKLAINTVMNICSTMHPDKFVKILTKNDLEKNPYLPNSKIAATHGWKDNPEYKEFIEFLSLVSVNPYISAYPP